MQALQGIRYALGGVTAGAVMLMPGVAGADTKSTQDEDFSIDRNSRRKMETCDMESDSQKVHSDIKVDGSNTTKGKYVTDGDGANGNCASRSQQTGENSISHHRTVEQRLLGDITGNWVSTT